MIQMYRSDSIAEFFPYVLAYMILFMPTLALANSIPFPQMTNPEKEFSLIRLWGTIGWIVAGVWKNVWLVPAGFSLLLMVIFAILFKPEKIQHKED